ncbi:MAG: hypothetical protein LBK82_17440 [Planctomycetaceae bacterium]|nr:hypothetical protein [Planctomycetaceae bacterium]
MSNHQVGNPPAGRLRRLTPIRKTTPFTVVNLIHRRRVRRRNLLANSERLPTL